MLLYRGASCAGVVPNRVKLFLIRGRRVIIVAHVEVVGLIESFHAGGGGFQP